MNNEPHTKLELAFLSALYTPRYSAWAAIVRKQWELEHPEHVAYVNDKRFR